FLVFFFFQAEDGIRDDLVTGVQTCALPISQLWGHGRRRRLLLGHQRQWSARRWHHDRAVDPCARWGRREVYRGERRREPGCRRRPHVRSYDRGRRLLLGRQL